MDIQGTIYRIIYSYYIITLDNEEYKIITPSMEIKHYAHLQYKRVLNGYKYDISNWMTKDQIDKALAKNGVWNGEKIKDLETLEKRLDDMKIELYLKYSDIPMRNKIKASLVTGRKNIASMYEKKHSMDSLSLEYFADSVRNEYIVTHTVYKDDKLFFDVNNPDPDKLQTFTNLIHKNSLSLTDLKSIARSQLWKTYWDSGKEQLFQPPAFKWTDEQRSLINLSQMYDAIRDNPDRPEDKVIEDDDALDGWMLFIHRRNEKKRKKEFLMDGMGDKYKKANEVFLIAKDQDEMNEIYRLNDAKTMAQIRHMHKLARDNDGKEIAWQDLPHVRAELQAAINEKNKDAIKRKK